MPLSWLDVNYMKSGHMHKFPFALEMLNLLGAPPLVKRYQLWNGRLENYIFETPCPLTFQSMMKKVIKKSSGLFISPECIGRFGGRLQHEGDGVLMAERRELDSCSNMLKLQGVPAVYRHSGWSRLAAVWFGLGLGPF